MFRIVNVLTCVLRWWSFCYGENYECF